MLEKIKILGLCMFFSFICSSLWAKRVEIKDAERVVKSYVQSKQGTRAKINVHLKYAASKVHAHGIFPAQIQYISHVEGQSIAYYYVFNIDEINNGGFVIVSGDDVVRPILGYSSYGNFDENNLPPNFAYWLDYLQQEISYAQEQNLPQSKVIQQEWDEYLSGNLCYTENAVEPLLQTTWNQLVPYNNLCPIYNGTNHSVTGCVATAMAQIMKYHQHPVQGSGQSTPYTTRTHGLNIPSVNFAVNYDWDNMLNSYSGSTSQQEQTAVATLMYHCGVSVQMDYGSSSGAYSSDVPIALTTYFGYDHSIGQRSRTYFNNESWENMLKTQIDAGLPIYYSGRSGTGLGASGHAFICDGYDNMDMFHFNWGWGGMYNGYFVTTALNPGTGGAGAGAGTYNRDQAIIINIKPDEGGVPTYELVLYNNFSTSTTAVLPNGTFTASVGIRNVGEAIFQGGYLGIALVNKNNGQIVEIVGNTSVESLPANTGFPNPFNINCGLSNNVTLGEYKLRAVFSLDGIEWKTIISSSGCPSSINFYVVDELIAVTGISLNKSELTLVVDDEAEQLIATIEPFNASNINITWSSSNPNIATVSYDGIVTARSGGTTIITVKTQDGDYTDTCEVTVLNGYEMSLRTFSTSSTAAFPRDTITVSTKVANVGQATFPGGFLGAALMDNNEQIVDVLGYVSRGSLDPGYLWTNPVDITCIIPEDVTCGEYKLIVVCRSAYEDWKIITLANGCPNSIDFQVLSLGISEKANETSNVTVFPNPAFTQLFIKLNLQEPTDYAIYNTMGQIVLRDKLHESSTINIESLIKGIYYFKISETTIKFIKQ